MVTYLIQCDRNIQDNPCDCTDNCYRSDKCCFRKIWIEGLSQVSMRFLINLWVLSFLTPFFPCFLPPPIPLNLLLIVSQSLGPFCLLFLPFPSFPLFSSSLLSPLTSLPLTVHPYPPHPLWASSSLLITHLTSSPSLPLLSTPSLFSLLRVSTSLELKTSLWPTFPTLPTLAWHAASRLLPFKPCESVLVHYPLNTNA